VTYDDTMAAIRRLPPGGVHTYHPDEAQARIDGVWRAASDASDLGLVTLHCRRRADGILERIAIKRRVG
jgi:hypothetical protein